MHVNSFRIVLEGSDQDLSDSVSVLASSVLHFCSSVMPDQKCENMHQTSSTYCT